MRDDDLSGLFGPTPSGPALPASYRVGRLTAFSADDGSNTVMIGTSTLTDLAMLVTGAEIGLEAGDNVLVMCLGNTPMIVGKIATVGGPNYGISNTGRQSFNTTTSGFGVTTSLVETLFDTTSIHAPGWANSALVTTFGQASIHNSGTIDNLQIVLGIFPGTLPQVLSDGLTVGVAAGVVGQVTAAITQVIQVQPDTDILFGLLLASGTHSWSVDSQSRAALSASVEFYRESTQ